MGRSKPNYIIGWTSTEREFCVEQYYLHKTSVSAAKRAYSEKFRPYNGNNVDKCPSSNHIRAWVKNNEDKKRTALMKQTEDAGQQRTDTSKEIFHCIDLVFIAQSSAIKRYLNNINYKI